MDDKAWPLGWDDRDGPVGSGDIPDGGLRARGQAGDEEGIGGEGAPGAGEKIGVDCRIDVVGAKGRASRVGEVLHEPEGFLTRLGGEGEGGTLEGADEGLDLGPGERADVAAPNPLLRDDGRELGWVGIESRAIGRGECRGDGADASIESVENGVRKVRVFAGNTGLGEEAPPGFCLVGRP